MGAAARVEYPEYRKPGSGNRTLEVINLQTPELLAKYGRSICSAINLAYSNAYEAPNGPLEPGTVARRYGWPEAGAWTERALGFLSHGSQYWAIVTANNSVAAFAKVTAFETEDAGQALYVNDVVARPAQTAGRSHQRRGYAAALLHSVGKFGGFDPAMPVTLDAFDASGDYIRDGFLVPGRNQLYDKAMGLVAIGAADPFMFPGDQEGRRAAELSMTQYHTPPGRGLGDVVASLENHHPVLENAQPVYTTIDN